MQPDQENGKWIEPRAALVTGIVAAAAALRAVPHPMNFAPIGAIALFSGTYFRTKRAAVAVPLLSLVAGDIFTGFHRLIAYVYASFLVGVVIGLWLKPKKSAGRIAGATIVGSIQFFLITNFGVWAESIGNYSKNWSGLVACYLAGLPLFLNTLAGDALYVALLFGAMALAEKRFPSLRKPLAAEAGQKLAFR